MSAGQAERGGSRRDELFDGVVGFVDLAGFTAAAERMGQFGPRGAEQLQDLINYVFTPVIAIVHEAGGQVGWFAGDAIGVVFDSAITPTARAVHALRTAALGVAEQTPYQTDDGGVVLGVKLGIGGGQVRWQTVSTEPEVSWFGGSAVDLAADAEGYAEPGDIIVHASVTEGLTDAAIVDLGDGFGRLTTLAESPGGEPLQNPDLAVLQDARFRPNRVARLAAAGHLDFLSEHRPVSSLFLRVQTSLHDPDQLERIIDILEVHGGFARPTEGDKGAMVLAIYGAPTALADRQELAVRAAVEVRELVPDAQIGITSGRVYCGPIGSPSRWDYSVLGDRVNTAARLMSAASPGEILLDVATADAVRDATEFGETRELSLKGKSELEVALPVEGHRPTQLLNSGSRFVGRRDESSQLLDRLARPGLALVTGVAGTGKSRLLGYVFDELATVPTLVAIEATDRSVPYGLWPRLFAAMIGAPVGGVLDALSAEVREDQRLPLLGPVLGRPLPDTPLTAALSGEDRPALMLEFVREVLASHASGSPVLVEDLHWADDESIDLLARLAPRLDASTVVATARPASELAALLELPSVDELALAPLDEGAMRELAASVWLTRLGAPAAAPLVEDLVDRSNGSPLFCEQLVSFAATTGVAPTAEALPVDAGIPDDLIDLLLAQLDALPEAAMTAASLAAIFGTQFSEPELVGAFGARYQPDRITGGLEILRDRGVVAGLTELRFAHSLFGETTYDRLSFALRKLLHLDVVRHLEVSAEERLDELVSTLAYHTERTDDDDRKRRYFRLAGDQAASQWANTASIRWYEGLLPLLDGHERGEIALALGRIETVAGDLTQAENHLIAAVKDLDEGHRTPAELGLAQVLIHQGSTGPAFDLIDESIERATADERWADVHAGMESKADFSTLLGDIERAEQVEAMHAELAGRFGADHPAGESVKGLVPLLWLRGDIAAALQGYRELFDEAVAADDLILAGKLASDLAGLAYECGEIAEVFAWLDRTAALAARSGDRRVLVLVRRNESEVRLELGDTAGSLVAAHVALAEAAEIQDARSLLVALEAVALSAETTRREALLLRSIALADRLADEDRGLHAAILLAGHWAWAGDSRWRLLIAGIEQHPLASPDVHVTSMRLAWNADGLPADVKVVSDDVREGLSARSRAELAYIEAKASRRSYGEAIAACSAAFDQFPSVVMRDYLGDLGVAVAVKPFPRSTLSPPSEPLESLIESVDALPELIAWAETADIVLSDLQREG